MNKLKLKSCLLGFSLACAANFSAQQQATPSDQAPDFEGGILAFRDLVVSKIDPKAISISSSVLSFTVEADGSMSNFEIEGGDEKVNETILASFYKMNTKKWTPAQMNGKPMRTRFRMPITLQN